MNKIHDSAAELTDIELSDPEFMRKYVSDLWETWDEMQDELVRTLLGDGKESVIHNLHKELAYKQSVIDALMLEYCPDEMTPEQLEEWSKHQIASDYPIDYTSVTNSKENT